MISNDAVKLALLGAPLADFRAMFEDWLADVRMQTLGRPEQTKTALRELFGHLTAAIEEHPTAEIRLQAYREVVGVELRGELEG